MTDQLMTSSIRRLEDDDLHEVAVLHFKAFPDSALTRLGLEPVLRYYQFLLTYDAANFNIGVFNDAKNLVGFCFSGYFSGSLSGFISHERSYLQKWIIQHPWKVLNPLILDRVKLALRISKGKAKPPKANYFSQSRSVGVLAIAVDPSQQGQGLGKKIMSEVERFTRSKDLTHMHLTVHQQNITAIKFYEGCGWKKVLTADNSWHGYMEKWL